jgi:hypothetical protein
MNEVEKNPVHDINKRIRKGLGYNARLSANGKRFWLHSFCNKRSI